MTRFEYIKQMNVAQLAFWLVDEVKLPESCGIGIDEVRRDVANREMIETQKWLLEPISIDFPKALDELNQLRVSETDNKNKTVIVQAMRTIQQQECELKYLKDKCQKTMGKIGGTYGDY